MYGGIYEAEVWTRRSRITSFVFPAEQRMDARECSKARVQAVCPSCDDVCSITNRKTNTIVWLTGAIFLRYTHVHTHTHTRTHTLVPQPRQQLFNILPVRRAAPFVDTAACVDQIHVSRVLVARGVLTVSTCMYRTTTVPLAFSSFPGSSPLTTLVHTVRERARFNLAFTFRTQ